ncbi:hypothetical protein EV421DRAFT_1981868 [Armillaria borealis]|uniref:MACPF domain-containing protein n=1 Tax=Armillaria borealis TaxID=47425 RepID=A0AA39J6G4_9AGAR|nr:hypothetical protein EV421DRAFT_1981868 [Armillaria borealis]
MSLPPPLELQMYLRRAFVNILDNADPELIYAQYGTHLVSNLIIGGRAAFTCTTDTTQYSADQSIEIAVQVSVKFSWATVLHEFFASVSFPLDALTSHVSFVEFGGTPAFTALYQFALTKVRQDELKEAYATYCKNYSTSLIIPGPYLHARFAKSNPRVASFITTDYREDRPDPVVFYTFSYGVGDGYVGLSQSPRTLSSTGPMVCLLKLSSPVSLYPSRGGKHTEIVSTSPNQAV